MKRESRKARMEVVSRTHILRSAIQAFLDRGYDGTSMRDISRLCGLGQPTIYHYFGSKENLFRLALRATQIEVKRYLRRRIVRKRGLKEELRTYFQGIRTHHRANPHSIRSILRMIYTAPPDIQEYFLKKYAGDYQAMILSAFVRHGPVAGQEHKVAMVVSLLHSLLMYLSLEIQPPRTQPGDEALLEFVLRAP